MIRRLVALATLGGVAVVVGLLLLAAMSCGPIPIPPFPCPTATTAPTATPTGTGTPVDPTPSPTATPSPEPTLTATSAPTATSSPTGRATATASPQVIRENFRGGIKTDSGHPWFRKGAKTCRAGGSTLWFHMTGGRLSCDTGSLKVQPADFDHMGTPKGTKPGQDAIDAATCKPVALQFSGRWWDDPRGPELRGLSASCVVDQSGNPYEWTVCCLPGMVTFSICPRANLHSCVNPLCTNGSCPCDPVPILSDGNPGCTPVQRRFPRLP